MSLEHLPWSLLKRRVESVTWPRPQGGTVIMAEAVPELALRLSIFSEARRSAVLLAWLTISSNRKTAAVLHNEVAI